LECAGVKQFLHFSKKQQDEAFFQGLGENSCSLKPALKNTAPGLYKDL